MLQEPHHEDIFVLYKYNVLKAMYLLKQSTVNPRLSATIGTARIMADK